MTQEEINEGNKLIAEFMDEHITSVDECDVWISKNGTIGSETNACYHFSWDWLMPVVEKIESEMKWAYEVQIGRNLYSQLKGTKYECIIHDAGDALHLEFSSDSKIEAVWLAVVEFIKWYNQNK